MTDQLALNLLLEEGSEWRLEAAPEDARVTLMRNATLRLHPLPLLLFPSGHVAFVQRLPWRCVTCRWMVAVFVCGCVGSGL